MTFKLKSDLFIYSLLGLDRKKKKPVQILIPPSRRGVTSCGDEWKIGVVRTDYMKRMAGIMDKFVAITTAPHVVPQIGLHPWLQPQTQAYPAWATRTLFAVIVGICQDILNVCPKT